MAEPQPRALEPVEPEPQVAVPESDLEQEEVVAAVAVREYEPAELLAEQELQREWARQREFSRAKPRALSLEREE